MKKLLLILLVLLYALPLSAQVTQRFEKVVITSNAADALSLTGGITSEKLTAAESLTSDAGSEEVFTTYSTLTVSGAGTGTNTMAAVRGAYVNASANSTVAGIGLYGGARDTSSGRTTTKYGVFGSATNSSTYTGGDGALFGGYFAANHLTSAANNVTNLNGVYGGVFTAGEPGGTVSEAMVFQAECDISITTSGGRCIGYDVKRINATTGGTATGFLVRNNGAGTGISGATIWSFKNDEESAPAYSASNWRAPFFANEVSSNIASSSTIAPTNGVHHITGASAIDTITVPAMCSPTCTIHLIPDAAFTTTTAGNIGLASTAVVGQTMAMTWDGTKWYPSY